MSGIIWITWVIIITVLNVVSSNTFNSTSATVLNLPRVDVTKWQKHRNTSGYDWDNPAEVTYLNNIPVGGNVTASTILADPDQHYSIACYADYYETNLDIDLPPTRKTFLKRNRRPDGDLFDIDKYHTETTLRFFTEEGKNGTMVCKSVEHPELNVTLYMLTYDKRSIQNVRDHSPSPKTRSTDKNTINMNGTANLEFSNHHGGIYCRDKNKLPTTKSMKMILCFSPYQCDLFKSCFNQNQSCSSATIQDGIPCETEDCIIIYEGYSVGMAQCKSGQDTETSMLLTGFDRRRYKVSQDIPTRALINMEDVEPVLYTNQRHFFFCSAMSFLFVDEIEFSLKFKNGTQIAIPQDLVSPATGHDMSSRLGRGLVQKGIYLNVTEEMTEVICMAPWYNSTKWLTTSKKFKARDIMEPSIKKSTINKNKKVITEVYPDEAGRILACSASGQPPPTFTWFRIRTNQSLENVSYATSTTEEESLLKFPPITPEVEGIYRCVATNQYGSDHLDFNVHIGGVNIGAIVGIAITVSAIIIIGFGLLWRKYQITKNELRNLTQNEVDEFENGNPEALALMKKSNKNLYETDPTHVHLLPFKRDYVISPADLVVDTTAVLGKGKYGIVMRGKLIGEPIAVKTTQPNADVTYFKALLSEVKVMTYIGTHENVVKFLGAVIKQIRQRIVYIAIEFSPYGDLQSFLKSHRKTFLQLYGSDNLNETRLEIEGSYVSNVKMITTLDMLNWSKQIAAGMGHLANKKVVHADLAARNVLLFHGYVAKITDFGLSRQLYEQANYVKQQQAPLPWRWMAIESLRDLEFSTASDVWAYGVTVWEIFSLAETPFPGQSWNFDFMEKLKEGLRLSKPRFSSADIYNEVMLNCWNLEPERRLSFEEIQDILNRKIEQVPGGIRNSE